MGHGRLIVLIMCVLLSASPLRAADADPVFDWQAMPPLPDAHGFAGAFAGVSNEALIVAGGANFPDAPPWLGGTKTWYDDIYVLEQPDGQWRKLDTKLPTPRGYGVSVTWRDAVICVGGSDPAQHYSDAFIMRYADGAITFEALPDLPAANAMMCGTLVGDLLYIAGGQSAPAETRALASLWRLDLAKPADQRAWEVMPDLPSPRILAVAGAIEDDLYVFGGAALLRDADGNPTRRYLTDAWRFRNGAWQPLAHMPRAAAAAPSPAARLGAWQLAIVGGDDGSLFNQPLHEQHPGFRGDVMVYNAATDAWATMGQFTPEAPDVPAPVTTNATWWRGNYILPSGEIRPGIRSPRVFAAVPTHRSAGFGTLNWIVLIVYLVAMIAIGVYFSTAEHSTDEFFLAGRRVPWFAAGLSIFGTQLSAITYLSIPAKSFVSDWAYLMVNVAIVAIAPLVIYFYLPRYRRLNLTSVYQYLEHRFDVSLRLLGSAAFVLFQMGRMAIVILLPALALAATTGLDVYLCVVLMGLLSTLYTALGGIAAVIWTDVVQSVVLLGGVVAALIVVYLAIDVPIGELFTVAAEEGKFTVAHFEWNWTGDTIAVLLIGGFFSQLVSYTSDQAVIQRYLTTPTPQKAARAIWTNAILAIPATLLFFALGTAIWMLYHAHPELAAPVTKTDQLLPRFVALHMPAGVGGLVIAGVFAAAMSSFDSSIHAMSTTITTDFYQRFGRRDDRQALRVARWLTIILGVFGTGASIVLATFQIGSLWDTFLALVGLLGGTMAGLFALAVFTTRPAALHAWIGAAASAATLLYVHLFTEIHGLMYAPIGVTTCFIVGWLASYILPARREAIPPQPSSLRTQA